jgi:hypothetical protein
LVDEDCAAASTEAFGNSYNFVFMENNVDDNPTAMSFLEVGSLALFRCSKTNINILANAMLASQTMINISNLTLPIRTPRKPFYHTFS